MPSLSKIASKCAKCRFVETCDHKQMQAEAYMELPSMPSIGAVAVMGMGGAGRIASLSEIFARDLVINTTQINKNVSKLK